MVEFGACPRKRALELAIVSLSLNRFLTDDIDGGVWLDPAPSHAIVICLLIDVVMTEACVK